MAFPLLFLALAYAAGCGLASGLDLPPVAPAVGLALALVGGWIFYLRRRTGAAFALVLVSSALLGAGLYAAAEAAYISNGLPRLPQGTYLDLTGTAVRAASPGADRDVLVVRVESVQFEGREETLRGLVRISVTRSAEAPAPLDIAAGDRLIVSAQIVPPREYWNFEEPFSRTYLRAQGIHALATAKSPLLVRKTGRGPSVFPARPMSRLRLACLRAVERYFPPPGGGPGISAEGAVFEALLLGERGRMDPGANLSLQSTGLYHLIAISGAHIGIISVILFGLFRAVRLPRRSAYALLLAVLVFYAFLVEGRASVARAVVMAAAFILAKLIWKDAHLLNAIGLSALVILVASPFQVLDMGFRLTYAATLAIILILPRLGSFLPRVPFKVGDMLGLTVAAQAGVTPMIAAAFNRVTFSGLALNLIGIPLVGVIMAAGYLFFPVAFAAPFLAKPAAVGLAFLMRAFLWSTHLLDGVPFLSYRIPTPSGIVVLGYYVFLLLLLLPARFRTSRRIAAVGFAVCFVVLVTYPFSPSAKEMTVTFLDVGQGDAILVEFPGRARMLVDAGGLPTGNFDVGESVVSPYLWRKGFKRLDLLAVSHDHPDHLYGLEAVARNFRIGEFWEPGSPAPDGPRTRLETVLAGVPRRAVGRRTTREIGGVRVEVLSPDGMPASYGTADNDRSLVLRLSFGETSVLLPGDIGLAAEEEIVATGADLRSGVLKAPHHGSDTSSSEAFLRAVRPETVVVSVGRGNRYGLPRAEVLDRYARSGARVYRTDLHGAVEVKSDGRRFSIRTSADPGPGRH